MRRGARGIVTPDDDQTAVGNIAGIGRLERPEGHLDGRLRGDAAERTTQAGGAHPLPESDARHSSLEQAERATERIGEDRGRAVLGDDVPPALGDLADGLLPGDASPLAASLWSDAAQWILQPIG